MDDRHTHVDYWDARGLVVLWLAVLSGPAAWAINQLIGYALVKPFCETGARYGMSIVAGVALAITAAGGWTAWSCFSRLRHGNLDGAGQADRSVFLAVAGLVLNALLGLLIMTSAIPPVFLSPCE